MNVMTRRDEQPPDGPSRRAVLSGFAAAATTLGLGAPATATPTPLLDFAIAGGGHHGLYDVIGRLAPGVRLTLVREPRNPFDADAVAVHLGTLRLGYVPRMASAGVAALLDGGRAVTATVGRRLDVEDAEEGWDCFAFTSFIEGDPLIELDLA